MQKGIIFTLIIPVHSHETEHFLNIERPDTEMIFVNTGNKLLSIDKPDTRMIEMRGAGFGEAVNTAAGCSRGEVLIIVNDDIYTDDNIFREYPDISNTVYLPTVIDYNTGDIESIGSTVDGFFRVMHNKADKVIMGLTGSAFIIGRHLFLDTGGFDEDYFLYYEDADLSCRLRQKNVEIVRAEKVQVRHKHSFSSSKIKRFYLQRNRILFAVKNSKNTGITLLKLFVTDMLMMPIQALRQHSLTPFHARYDAMKLIRTFYRKRHAAAD